MSDLRTSARRAIGNRASLRRSAPPAHKKPSSVCRPEHCQAQRRTIRLERAHSAFQVSDLCVRCGEAVENLEHINHCPHWYKERREIWSAGY
eukprot:1397926-Amphidinium_carterae.2